MMKKINFKQSKYVLPLILYPLILGTGYFIIGMFTTEVKSVDKNLMATNYLNSELPEAKIDEELGSKRENMVNAFGDAKDYTAVENAERDSVKGKEEYQSRYNHGEAAAIVRHDEELDNLRQLQRRKQENAARGMGKDDFIVPLSDEDRRNARRLRGREGREETEDLLAQARAQGRGVMGSASASFDDDDEETPRKKGRNKEYAGTVADGEEKAETVVKVMKTESEYFNTVSQNAPGSSLITAIIDENIKAVDGSRVRLRLLDDVEIGGLFVPKGTYLYATMSGFGKQRVKGKVASVFVGDEIKTINLSIYDTDGMEGLYVPSSTFRETAKDIGSSAMQQSMSIDGSSSNNSVSQWAQQTVQQAYQRTSQAISKAIRKNKVKLKYGTRVYLINGQQLKSDKRK